MICIITFLLIDLEILQLILSASVTCTLGLKEIYYCFW